MNITENPNTDIILCPICNRGKLIVQLARSEVNIIPLPPDQAECANWYLKCNVCKHQIGLTIKEQQAN